LDIARWNLATVFSAAFIPAENFLASETILTLRIADFFGAIAYLLEASISASKSEKYSSNPDFSSVVGQGREAG
jgi:hypothetical protein